MRLLKQLFDNNRQWAEGMLKDDPAFFQRLTHQQSPEFLWVGCSDSRVPANQIVGTAPGSIFVHRNIANIVRHDDCNCLAVLYYAIQVLKVKHILVVGHYRCGGVKAVLDDQTGGIIGDWLQPIVEVERRHRSALAAYANPDERWDRLCELNVVEQALSLARTGVVREAWSRGQELAVHGWIYGVHNGLLRDLDITITGEEDASAQNSRPVELLRRQFVATP
jgi:carbonic anhydrase